MAYCQAVLLYNGKRGGSLQVHSPAGCPSLIYTKGFRYLACMKCCRSNSSILCTLGAEPPPAKSQPSQMSTRYLASSTPITRSPMHIICALLLFLERSAENGSWQTAARIPGTLLAQIAMPIPVPHTRIPLSYSPAATASATA